MSTALSGSIRMYAECSLIIGTGCRVQVFAWPLIAQSVCQRAFSLLEIWFQRPSGFESCIQQGKTTCFLTNRTSLACARASKLTATNKYMRLCVWDSCYIIFCYLLHIHSGKTGNLFSLLLCSLWWMQIIGYVLSWRSYLFVCTLHHLIIIIVKTYLKTLNL